MDVTISGVFPSDNKFTVVAYKDWNNPARRWEYPAQLRGNKLVTILREPELANSQNFGLKVIASSPETETDAYYSFKAFTKSTVRLTSKWGYEADTLNSTDPIVLAFTTTPMSPGEITLNTGNKFQLHYSDYEWVNGYTTTVNLPKTKDGTYFIKEASNVCGSMDISGQVTVKVNSIDFMPVSISAAPLCIGSEFKVKFSTDKADFNANTKFRIRFSSDNTYFDSYDYMDAPAVLSGKKELTAIIPEGLSSTMLNQGIYIGIVTENPAAISINKGLKININPKPSFSFTPDSHNINIGEHVQVSANPTGFPPFKFTLTNGEVFDYNVLLSPETTTQYQVKTFESGCGIIENPSHTPLTVTVKPSLLLGEPESTGPSRTFCEGQTVRMRFRANGVNPQTSYVLEGTTESNEKFVFPAKVIGDSLEFFIPKNTAQDPKRDYSDLYMLRIVSSNPALASPYSAVKVQSPPYMLMAENSQKSVPFPSAVRMDYNLYGGGPYIAEMAGGTKQTYEYRNIWFYQYILQDTTFKLASLSNECFRNNDLPAFSLKVDNPGNTTPALFARLINKDYCMGDSVEVELNFSGKFEAGNQFTISYLRFAQADTYPIRNVTKPGIYKVKLPERLQEGYDASLQLSSSLPRLISETDRFNLKVKPSMPSIQPQASKDQPAKMFLGESPGVAVFTSDYTLIHYALDGKENTIRTNQNGTFSIPLELASNKVSEFRLKSVTNSCGSYAGEITSYFIGVAYKININPYTFPVRQCIGSDSEIQFSLESGTAAPSTKFTLQISATGSQDTYTDLATATDSHLFKFAVPNVKTGNYYFRVRSSDNIYSEPVYFYIGDVPTATFQAGYESAPGDTIVLADYGSQVYLTTYLTGSDPWGLVYNDGRQEQVTSNYTTYAPTVTGEQTFFVSKVWNSCGYGTASGKVTVKVKPGLELKKYPENADAIICPGQKVQLDYEIKGMEPQGNSYLVFSITGDDKKPVKLDSVKNASGRIELKIPQNIVGQIFFIKAEVASLQLSKTISYQIYTSPDITLFGDNIITAGESTNLYVRANNSFAYSTSFELSDGTSQAHTAPFPGGVTQIKVTPSITTTFTLKELKSTCGVGKVSGSATITVQPRLPQWLSIQRIEGLRKSNICGTDTVQIYFNLNGNQAGVNEYEVLLSDSTGRNFVSIPTSGQFSPLTAVIPAGVKQSGYYRIRLISKSQNISGSTYPESLRIGSYAQAKVLTPAAYYLPGQPVNVVIGLEGSSPFYYRFGDDNFSLYRNTAGYSDTIRLTPVTPVATYKILQVENECGVGKVGDPSSFQFELITAAEPASTGEVIQLGPNPASSELVIQFVNSSARQLEILHLNGTRMYTGLSAQQNATIDLSHFPTGIYILQVHRKQLVSTYRIIKY
ncbi:T9SS type A sorting domain-containing protein [Dyadobacter sediminis]|nr:T9SS type A sorting domain-containing protein [Dyadobacter sediminis]GGC06930.1 hypothetical protein GCM10011325_37200 [Dyadobacter sediminis]